MHDEPQLDDFDDDEELISKSQLKREAHALQALGERLLELPAEQLATVPLPDELARAIDEAKRIKARGALKRHRQYIGKLMRSIEPEPIEAALEKLASRHAESIALQHRLERWRDRLLEEGDGALAELLEEVPHADRQHLRQLMRNARQERERNKPPKSNRELFRYLRDLMEEAAE